jgi:hypothetical protein
MPARHHIDQARRFIVSTGWGVLTKDDLVAQTQRVLGDPDFDPHYRQLWDLTEVTEFPVTFPEMMAIAEVNVFAPDARRALLAPSNNVFGIARMFEMLRESKGEKGIRVFRDRAEAFAWLELDPATVEVPSDRGSS